MSKPEATAAKSLEEIIASIRKSLAGQASGSGGRGNVAKAERVEPELALPADGPVKEPDPADGQFADRLAGALNGSNGAPIDDDLSDILAQDERAPAPPKRDIPAPPAAEDKPPELPWRADRSAAKAPAAPAQVELSRPEDLRRSLPPLFGEEPEKVPTSPDVPLPPLPAAMVAKPLGDILAAEALPPVPMTPPAERIMAPAKAGPLATPASPAVAPPPVVAMASVADAAVESGPAVAPFVAPSPAVPAAAVANGAYADAAKPAPALSSRALEQVIAELLEPVIRHWLDANLPRLIEKVVREEVVKAIAADRAVPKV
jgi:cell pole-organizing protein PopZ